MTLHCVIYSKRIWIEIDTCFVVKSNGNICIEFERVAAVQVKQNWTTVNISTNPNPFDRLKLTYAESKVMPLGTGDRLSSMIHRK